MTSNGKASRATDRRKLKINRKGVAPQSTGTATPQARVSAVFSDRRNGSGKSTKLGQGKRAF